MNDTQTRNFNMGAVCLDGIDDNNAIWTANATATAKRDLLEDQLNTIEEADEAQQAASTGGEVVTKSAAKLSMADEAEIIAQGVCAYAMDTNNNNVFNQFHKSEAAILRMKDVDSLAWCNQLHEFANTNIGVLGPYNITAGQVTAFQTKINVFDNADSDPVEAIGLHHAATVSVGAAITAMFHTLHWFDLYVGSLRNAHPDFFNAFRQWRKRIDTGVRHVAIRGRVVDNVTGTPLYKAKISVTNLPVPKVAYSGRTGKFRIFSLNPGVYSLTIELPGCLPTVLNNVSVLDGQITTINTSLIAGVSTSPPPPPPPPIP